MSFTSLSVGQHSTRSFPDLHVIWEIKFNDGEEKTTWKRYKDFAALDTALRGTHAPPHELPPRKSLSLRTQPYAFLDDQFIEERRQGLQQFLEGIAYPRTSVALRDSAAWGDFFQDIVAPTDDAEKVEHDSDVKAAKSPYKAVNCYFLHTYYDTDRRAVLDAIKAGGFSYIRIFITKLPAGSKGSNSRAVNDVEPNQLGVYDDTVLSLIDQLMVDCKARGLKLIIALHDRYALGFWGTDRYALTYGIVKPGTSGAQRVVDASTFYRSNDAMTFFDQRVDHILAHKNPLLDYAKWSSLGSVVFAFEPQNEPCGHMSSIPYTGWVNDRCGRIKESLPSGTGILVANGGGVDFNTSKADWLFKASNVDIVCFPRLRHHPYNIAPKLSDARGQAIAAGKTLLFEEWGIMGNSKASIIKNFVDALNAYNIPWAYWQVTKPGKGASDYELWTDEASWGALTS